MPKLPPYSPWPPTTFRRFAKAIKSSTATARIVTDAGPAFVKALGNPQGPHALACDLVGTHLARWFGLPTFDLAILELEEADEIPFYNGGRASPGPAFVTREQEGSPWSGDAEDLNALDNPEDIARLVVFDNWLRNCDRHPPDLQVRKPNHDNVFLSAEGATEGHFKLIAMDHGHCFTCGRELTPLAATIEAVRDERVYGLFPAFRPLVQPAGIEQSLAKLTELPAELVDEIIAGIPAAWEVTQQARQAVASLIRDRAAFLAGDAAAFTARLLAG